MMKPTFSEAKALATKGYKVVPICYEIMSDVITPIELLRKLKQESEHCYILESVVNQEYSGRYTYLGYNPTLNITCSNGVVKVKDVEGNIIQEEKTLQPNEHIKKFLKEYASPKLTGLPTFTGGLVGYFSYDYIKYVEPTLVLDGKDEEGFHDFDLMLFDKVICFDNLRQKIILIANAKTDDMETGYKQAVEDIKQLVSIIRKEVTSKIPTSKLKSEFKPLFNKKEFCQMVEEGKKYIFEGDIFQVVLSNRLEAEFEGSLFDAYRMLRTSNPSPYMFYFSGDEIEVAGSSPETLVKLNDGALHTFPLAGTRPRGANEEEDKALESDLLSDEKELAEHNMLVDLGRNDLGRISKFGSVEVEKYMSIERYSHVMHIGSTVKGIIREDCSGMDAIDAVLPAGTLSGAPKIRACEIINRLENNKRGIYGGAVGYMDFTGNLDTCIAIRIAYKKNGKVFIRSGAGIVADSIPEKEYEECINKAQAVVNAVEQAQEVDNHDFINR
ncbi:anthranilate synthase component I [Ornithinibacillus sp. 4-3]|uniref:Anthranilate synthase component 1 n=1 Tax=Ornithinibacillus sp. 4-3 TaxID=3231488 RepID=A0AB39HIZ0_9BACI